MHMLADELENTSVRVNSVNPGPVATALRLQAYPAEDRSKLAAPGEVLGPFLYLLGPESRGVTNQRFE
jgi:NAD(P)-dependent dehydrogenase (short-subunit alcohol dehydrogenase family)